MKKKIILILVLVSIILITGLAAYINGRYINPTDFDVTYLDIESEQVPKSFQERNILFISDLEYGSFFNEDRLNKFIDHVNRLHADIVIFGGDLFDRNFVPMSEDVNLLIQKLTSIKAELGKFAILGDYDQTTSERSALVTKILYDSNFEMLQGNSIALHCGESEYINLVGFNYTEDFIDMTESFSNTVPEDYTIAVIHGARMISYLPVGTTDLTLSGHSHHVQINLPFMVDKTYQNTGGYAHGKYSTQKTLLYVTRGVGTTNKDFRIFSDPEIVSIRFKKLSSK